MLGNSAMQRKKSLPDVATLPQVTVKQGSQAMTREEISVLSSARREEIRRQLEEAERYRANPILYILNPHIRVSNVKNDPQNRTLVSLGAYIKINFSYLVSSNRIFF